MWSVFKWICLIYYKKCGDKNKFNKNYSNIYMYIYKVEKWRRKNKFENLLLSIFRKKYETCGGSLTSRFIIAGWKCQVCIIEISVEYLSLKKYFYIENESNELIIYLFSIIKWIWHFKKVQKHDFNILKIIRFVMSIYLF